MVGPKLGDAFVPSAVGARGPDLRFERKWWESGG